MIGRVAVLALVVVAGGCSGGRPEPTTVRSGSGARPAAPHVKPKPLWSFDPDSYFSDQDFLYGSAFSHDLAVVANTPPGGSGGSVGVVGLEVNTGRELWRKDQLGWVLHPPHATEPLYFVPYEQLGEFAQGYVHLQRLDPKTGAVTATIALDRKPELDFELRIVWSAPALLAIGDGVLTAFDWSTGKQRWQAKVSDNAYLFPPEVIGDRIYLPNTTNLVISLVDGKQLAAIPGECCTVVASPDGKHVFVRAAVNAMAELGPDLAVVRRLVGEVRAASNLYYAVDTSEGAPAMPPVVTVYAYGKPDPVIALVPRDKDDFYGAVALSGRYLFYFHAADATLTQTDLTAGSLSPEVIDTVGSHFVISPDATGTAGPLLSTPPIVERPYLFTEEWGVHGYLIGDE